MVSLFHGVIEQSQLTMPRVERDQRGAGVGGVLTTLFFLLVPFKCVNLRCFPIRLLTLAEN